MSFFSVDYDVDRTPGLQWRIHCAHFGCGYVWAQERPNDVVFCPCCGRPGTTVDPNGWVPSDLAPPPEGADILVCWEGHPFPHYGKSVEAVYNYRRPSPADPSNLVALAVTGNPEPPPVPPFWQYLPGLPSVFEPNLVTLAEMELERKSP